MTTTTSIKNNHIAMSSLFKSIKYSNSVIWANDKKPSLWIKDNFIVSLDSNDMSLQSQGFTKCLDLNYGDIFNMKKLRSLLS